MGSAKQGQGLRKARFVKNSVMNSEHSCQSCEQLSQNCMSNGSRSLKKKKKDLHDINFMKQSIFLLY